MEGFLYGVLTAFLVFCIKEYWKNYIDKRRLAIAFLAELNSLFYQYEKMGGEKLFECDAKGTRFTMKISEDFCIVYNANADRLGLFDEQLVSNLVKLYTNVKGFICTIRTWDFILEQARNNDKNYNSTEIKLYSEAARNHYNLVKKDSSLARMQLKKIANECMAAGFFNYIIASFKALL